MHLIISKEFTERTKLEIYFVLKEAKSFKSSNINFLIKWLKLFRNSEFAL